MATMPPGSLPAEQSRHFSLRTPLKGFLSDLWSMNLPLLSSRFVGAAQHCQPDFGLRRLGGNWARETGCLRPRSGTGRMRNGCNARELCAFFRGFAQELGNRQEHVTCWLCRQSGANSSLKAEFPVHREETGNFSKNRGFRAIDVAKTRSGSMHY
jgi:hypothetical protein